MEEGERREVKEEDRIEDMWEGGRVWYSEMRIFLKRWVNLVENGELYVDFHRWTEKLGVKGSLY